MPNTGRSPVKIWSELHGDMQSQTEQKRSGPDARTVRRGNNIVGPYPLQP